MQKLIMTSRTYRFVDLLGPTTKMIPKIVTFGKCPYNG